MKVEEIVTEPPSNKTLRLRDKSERGRGHPQELTGLSKTRGVTVIGLGRALLTNTGLLSQWWQLSYENGGRQEAGRFSNFLS